MKSVQKVLLVAAVAAVAVVAVAVAEFFAAIRLSQCHIATLSHCYRVCVPVRQGNCAWTASMSLSGFGTLLQSMCLCTLEVL